MAPTQVKTEHSQLGTPQVRTTQTHHRSCHFCEAICGLIIEHDGHQVLSIKGDPEDPLSKGHICPKAIALRDFHHDPQRLRKPLVRDGKDWKEVSWQQAYCEVVLGLNRVRDKHGNHAVATYLGNPTVHSYGAMLFLPFLGRALASRNRYSATSVDQLPHHLVASLMYGHANLLPVPDIDRTMHMLILGANPVVSNGSMMTAPGMRDRLQGIQKRGGQVIVVDPKRTQTARLADAHHFINPGSDALLLAAILQVIFANGLESCPTRQPYIKHVQQLQEVVQAVTPEEAARATGIARHEIERIAIEFATAERAVCYGRFGVSTQAHGGVCQWLIHALNLITGNFDRPGGLMFPTPAVNLVGKKSTRKNFGRWQTRVRSLPEFDGQFPVAALAEEILTPGKGQIRALITHAGNPVLSTPNGRQLERALQDLEFMVCIDPYLNETTRHADIILPPACGLENDGYDLAFQALAVRNVAKYWPALFPPSQHARHDWQILQELSYRLHRPSGSLWKRLQGHIAKRIPRWLTPTRMLSLGLFLGPYASWRNGCHETVNLKNLKRQPHGIDLRALQPRMPDALRHPDRKVDAAPSVFCKRLAEIANASPQRVSTFPTEDVSGPPQFALISRRHLRGNNSWMHQFPTLIKGKPRCTIQMSPTDAKQLQFVDQQLLRVRSRVGEIDLPLELCVEIKPGVISIPHGYGHNRPGMRIPVAEANAGASINDLSDELLIDKLTGTAAFSGQFVTVESIPPIISL
ncbi:MAG: molybdopterin-dependent oxidoreductase [Planctomycetes bacterium]|nr:molybdopterin-dependent oxidoreductase [Planctomycetota bacterium]